MGLQPAPWWLSSAALVPTQVSARRPGHCAVCRAVLCLPACQGGASKVAAVPEGRLGFLDGQRGLASVGLSGHVVEGVRMK